MFFCLTIAIISTLLWINMLFAEAVNSATRHYAVDNDDRKREIENSKLRIVLSIIMGFFWSAVIYYW